MKKHFSNKIYKQINDLFLEFLVFLYFQIFYVYISKFFIETSIHSTFLPVNFKFLIFTVSRHSLFHFFYIHHFACLSNSLLYFTKYQILTNVNSFFIKKTNYTSFFRIYTQENLEKSLNQATRN